MKRVLIFLLLLFLVHGTWAMEKETSGNAVFSSARATVKKDFPLSNDKKTCVTTSCTTSSNGSYPITSTTSTQTSSSFAYEHPFVFDN